MRNREVPVRFFQGAKKGGTKHVFIEGDAIFSYGAHFPMAFKSGKENLFLNKDKYSSSTSAHQSALRREIPSFMKVKEVRTQELIDIMNKKRRNSAW